MHCFLICGFQLRTGRPSPGSQINPNQHFPSSCLDFRLCSPHPTTSSMLQKNQKPPQAKKPFITDTLKVSSPFPPFSAISNQCSGPSSLTAEQPGRALDSTSPPGSAALPRDSPTLRAIKKLVVKRSASPLNTKLRYSRVPGDIFLTGGGWDHALRQRGCHWTPKS